METNMDVFINRLKKINIDVGLISNYPYIYLDIINTKRVNEKSYDSHGFILGYYYYGTKDKNIIFNNIKQIFKIIRKYK